MSGAAGTQVKSYVIVPIGNRKFSLAAESVVELIPIGKLQQFPHRTTWISGVIVRRNRVVPVCDVRRLLGERNDSIGRFYLIAEWQAGNIRDWCAIPVTGECELASDSTVQVEVSAEHQVPDVTRPFQVGEDRIQSLDLGKLIQEWQESHDVHAQEPGS